MARPRTAVRLDKENDCVKMFVAWPRIVVTKATQGISNPLLNPANTGCSVNSVLTVSYSGCPYARGSACFVT
jgi:hypothetical protein